MRIQSLRVRRFRSIFDASIECSSLTVFVGRNGSGKSCFLQALSLFYSSGAGVTNEDFFHRDISIPITISVTFDSLTDSASELFQPYLNNRCLTIDCVITEAEGKIQSKYYGSRLSCPAFGSVRNQSKAAAMKEAYVLVREDARFQSLPTWQNQSQALAALSEWEVVNPDQLTWSRDDGQFFGFKSVAQGYLGRFTRFLCIPAVRDAINLAAEGKGSALTDLMDLVVRSVIASREDVQAIKIDAQRRYSEALDPARLTELGDLEQQLSRTLQTFAPNASLRLTWQPLDELNVPMPKADARLVEDNFVATVERTGHGLQRAFILSLLQHLAVASREAAASPANSSSDGSTPSLVLALEEPELYQHPTRQRHIARVLRSLARGEIPGVADSTQILYTTHSPLLVGLDRFDEIRLVRKGIHPGSEGKKCSVVVAASAERIALELWRACGSPDNQFTSESLIARLTCVMTSWMNEGFFADVAVLVEGESDRAAMAGEAARRSINLDSLGVAVIPCGGKASIDRPAIIFRDLGIPVYMIWDGDHGRAGARLEENHRLLRLNNEATEDWPETTVRPTYACFRKNLEDTLRSELTQEVWDSCATAAQEEFGFTSRKDALKNPVVLQSLLDRAAAERHTSPTLTRIVDAIIQVLQEAA